MPLTQFVHEAAFTELKVPRAHGEHVELLTDPANFPESQSEHDETPPIEYCPSGQSVQEDKAIVGENVPNGQALQLVIPGLDA